MEGIEPSPRVLFVGGIDPSGAAGILADAKTAQELGVFSTCATTAVTVQNRHSVSDIMPAPASLLGAQMDAVWADAPVDVVKTGMLVGGDIVRAISERIGRWGSSTRLVVDPVLRSSSGRALLDEDGRKALIELLLPQAALLTPNLLEAEELTGQTANSVDEMSRLADYLLAMGANAVLIKGGHLLERDPELDVVVDLLRTIDGEEYRLSHGRLHPAGSRGTGCTLAAAISAGLAEGLTLRSAVETAGDFVHAALEQSARQLPTGALHHSAHRSERPAPEVDQ